MHYDPMIAKLVVQGENRVAALVKLKDSLTNFLVLEMVRILQLLLGCQSLKLSN
jgi:acetyl/propionyl-CoA carboxylase alpha subunit